MSTQLIFKTLELRNFLSFGNQMQTIELADQGTVAIMGENLDTGLGSSSGNAVGKTSIINALCYVLYNKPLDSISLQKLVNVTNSLKNTLMEVRLTFEKDGAEYEVYRARGEEYRIEVRRDGVNITPGKGVYETDDMIQEIVGISYELFTKTVIFSGASPAFLQQPVAAQRGQIEELFNITLLSEKATRLKEQIRGTEGDIRVAEAVLQQQEAAAVLHRRHVQEAALRVQRWEEARVREVAGIESTLARIAVVDFDGEQLLHDEKLKLQQQGAVLGTRTAPARKDRTTLTAAIERLLMEQRHLQDARCPYCAQPYVDAFTKLIGIEEELRDGGARLLGLDGTVRRLEEEEAARLIRLAEVQAAIRHADLHELVEARTNSALLQQKLRELRAAANPHAEAQERLLVEGCGAANSAKVDALRRRLEHQQFLLKLLTDKNSFLRRRIISRSIPFLNARINHYTNALGLPHAVKFDADMSCTVSEFGRELDFGNLSAGEKKRVNVSMSLAFRDVLHRLHARVNLSFIDEVDGSLDQHGIDTIVKVLKEKSRDDGISIFVISHHPSVQGRLDRELRVLKSGGFSSIVHG